MDAASFAAPSSVDRLGRVGLLVGLVGAVVAAVGAFVDLDRFYTSYLVGFLWMAAVPVGSLALLMLHHVTGGGWGFMVRRVLEASVRTLPLVALFFVPILLGLSRIFPWADPEVVAQDPLIQHKAAYLNSTAFLLRAVLFFAVWIGLGLLLDRMSHRQDRTGEPGLSNRMGALSAPGLIAWCLMGTFAGVDWIMSLEPHWFSSIYGVYFFESMALGALAFTVLMAVMLSRSAPMAERFTKGHFHDYGNLMLAFTMLWGYFTFSQLLIIWSGNLPEEVPWYLERITGGWKAYTIALVVLHFAVPFLLLLTHAVKGRPQRLVFVAGLLLAMRYVDYFWQVMPPLHRTMPHWMDAAVLVGLGGLWLGFFSWQLKRRSLVPFNDPRFQETAIHG